jgi:hypothetical protein
MEATQRRIAVDCRSIRYVTGFLRTSVRANAEAGASSMKVARWIYLVAGVYGIVVLVPGFFLEQLVDPPPLTHPEFYYGFYGSALVWQFVFLAIARDPVKLRSLMPITFLEKLAFFIPSQWLHVSGRLPMGGPLIGGMIDGVLLILFVFAWWRTREARSAT